jgi:membrane-associated phospholipid phosphatase
MNLAPLAFCTALAAIIGCAQADVPEAAPAARSGPPLAPAQTPPAPTSEQPALFERLTPLNPAADVTTELSALWREVTGPVTLPPYLDAIEQSGAAVEPTCPQFSLADDCRTLVPEFFQDVHGVFTRENVFCLLAVGGLSYAVHKTIDDDVAANTGRHANRWGKGQEFFGGIGAPGHHFAAIAGLYGYSLYAQDADLHDLSKSLFNAVAITGASTVLLKATMGSTTEAPSGEPDPFIGAWPSGHTSSSFAVASVLDEYYGPKVGVPAYLLAGLVGWERIDDREHDLSDVIFGAALGYVVGKTVARNHRGHFCGMELEPIVDPMTGAVGVSFERRF